MTREELKQALDNLKEVTIHENIIDEDKITHYNAQKNYYIFISSEGRNGIRHTIWVDEIRYFENKNQYWMCVSMKGFSLCVYTENNIENIRSIEVVK